MEDTLPKKNRFKNRVKKELKNRISQKTALRALFREFPFFLSFLTSFLCCFLGKNKMKNKIKIAEKGYCELPYSHSLANETPRDHETVKLVWVLLRRQGYIFP
jgi:hypothetical protein